MPQPHDLGAPPPYIAAAIVLALTVIIMGLFAATGLAPALPGLPSLPLASAKAPTSPVSPRAARAPPLEPGDKYPGMVNLSGTLCYMNSVLQAFASLPTQIHHLERIVALATDVDVPTPVTDALLDVLTELNTGHARQPPALRPHALLAALATLPQVRRLLATREQQDAHELFVVLAEAVGDEATKVAKEIARTRGLAQALDFAPATPRGPSPDHSRIPSPTPSTSTTATATTSSSMQLPASLMRASSLSSSRAPSVTPTIRVPMRRPETALTVPWEGLLARRRVCRRCGFSDIVRMDTLGGMELPIPRSGEATLDQCISEYLAPEALEGVTCDMCTLRATADKYAALAAAAPVKDAETGAAKKKRQATARAANRLKLMVESGVPAVEAVPNVKPEVVRTECVRETAVTRAPRTLRFHFVRSEYTPYGQLLKKTARINYPLVFDMGAHMARGVWEPKVEGGVSAQLANGAGAGPAPRALYRLQSAILHYGYTHSSGHFVAIRRKPGAPLNVPGRGWLRISDADVDEVGPEELVATRGQVFMLFYERVDLPKGAEAMLSAAEEARKGGGEGQGVLANGISGGAPHDGEVDSSPGTPAESMLLEDPGVGVVGMGGGVPMGLDSLS